MLRNIPEERRSHVAAEAKMQSTHLGGGPLKMGQRVGAETSAK
jgi:hypothetical protein